jgi:hypothetical protein
MFESELALLKSRYETEEDELNRAIKQETVGEEALLRERRKISKLRSSDETVHPVRQGKR